MSENYRVAIDGKNIEVTNSLREYVLEKFEKTEKLTSDIIDVAVKLEVHKLQHECTLLLKFSHSRIKVHAVTEDLYSAIDKAFDKLRSQLRRWKTRIQAHHAKGVSAIDVEVQILEHRAHEKEDLEQDIIEENNATLTDQDKAPAVVKKKTRKLKTLTLNEAWMKMDLTNDNFMVYRSEEERTIKVIYRRRDGSYGVLSTE